MTNYAWGEPWTLELAFDLIRKLEKHLAPVGFHIAMAGSVLHKGQSSNDLDLIAFPHDTSHVDMTKAFDALMSAGLVLVHPRWRVAKAWVRQESTDTKHVEVWNYIENGRDYRIDLFFLR